MVLGLYYLTRECSGLKGEGRIFGTIGEINNMLIANELDINAIIAINGKIFEKKSNINDGILITTPGKVIFNEIMPADFPYINDGNAIMNIAKEDFLESGQKISDVLKTRKNNSPFAKKTIQEIVMKLYLLISEFEIFKYIDELKNIGFKYATIFAPTISVLDLPLYSTQKEVYFNEANNIIDELKQQYEIGLLTDDERYLKTIDI
jgi:DNA-directed RNA polymerase beta' subunit